MAEGDNGWAYTGGNFVPGRGYAFQQAGGDVVSFDGQANSGVVLGPLVGDNQIGTDDENWSFVGNPYPSGIHAGQLLAENEGVSGCIKRQLLVNQVVAQIFHEFNVRGVSTTATGQHKRTTSSDHVHR